MKTAVVLSVVAVAAATLGNVGGGLGLSLQKSATIGAGGGLSLQKSATIGAGVALALQKSATVSVSVAVDESVSGVANFPQCGSANAGVIQCNAVTKPQIDSIAALPGVQKIVAVGAGLNTP
ncbi:hypothetical protein AaE_014531 [Aphanomyces astaci]|uniref:Subtilisin n=1 Tax=Aphanomyces astaci TaxID=112090 RepID=A0A397BH60_APHAT|nr:hypothetical protein AaE_014531 [Aphanomyces astaci]RHY17308.1 hypothetical protein DYB36_011631 [Aphanomyces astaci]